MHPTSLVDPSDPTNLSKFLAPEAMRGSGGILVDARGKRFANELTTRAVLTEAIFKAGEPLEGTSDGEEVTADKGIAPIVAYLIMNEEAAEAFGKTVLGFYMGEYRGYTGFHGGIFWGGGEGSLVWTFCLLPFLSEVQWYLM